DYFNSVDKLADEFIGVFQNDSFKELKIIVNENTISKTPFELFTHVITHEFHHKGQILSLSRHLGYLPVDTDIIR
ncbi:MAG: DinB family protein, partial [Chitinophagaceae bacterium]